MDRQGLLILNTHAVFGAFIVMSFTFFDIFLSEGVKIWSDPFKPEDKR